jgi:hypothetical protein
VSLVFHGHSKALNKHAKDAAPEPKQERTRSKAAGSSTGVMNMHISPRLKFATYVPAIALTHALLSSVSDVSAAGLSSRSPTSTLRAIGSSLSTPRIGTVVARVAPQGNYVPVRSVLSSVHADAMTSARPVPSITGAVGNLTGGNRRTVLRAPVRTGRILSVLVPSRTATNPISDIAERRLRARLDQLMATASSTSSRLTDSVSTVRQMPSVATNQDASVLALSVAQPGRSVGLNAQGGTATSGSRTGGSDARGSASGASAQAARGGASAGLATLDPGSADRALSDANDPTRRATDSGSSNCTSSGNQPSGTPEPGQGAATDRPVRANCSAAALPNAEGRGGAYGQTIADCMSVWDPTTHISKAQWRVVCARTTTRR